MRKDAKFSMCHDIPDNPNIRKVRVGVNKGYYWISDTRFPNLEVLILAKDGDLVVLPAFLFPKLRCIELEWHMIDFERFWKKKFYPALEKIIIHQKVVSEYIREEKMENIQVKLRQVGVSVVFRENYSISFQ